MSLQDLVEIFNRDGDYEMLVNLLDSLTSYYRELPVQLSKIYALMGDAYSHQGDLEHAAVAYDKALQKFHDFKQVHDELCRVYGLLDDPEKALDNCELASLANPDYWTYYNRGKVYAMLGFWKDSIQDFEMVSKLLESSTGENERKLVEQVNDWIGILQQGENPITAEVLAEERAQAMDQAMPTQTIEEQAAPSGIDLQAAAAGFGFTVFKASEMKDPFQDNGLPFVEASLAFGECSSTLALQDDEVMVQKVMMVMKGCNQMEEYAMGIRLIDEFFPGKEDKAKALIWLFKEANLVIEENEAKSKIATVRNCNLNAINDFTTQSTQLLFSCH